MHTLGSHKPPPWTDCVTPPAHNKKNLTKARHHHGRLSGALKDHPCELLDRVTTPHTLDLRSSCIARRRRARQQNPAPLTLSCLKTLHARKAVWQSHNNSEPAHDHPPPTPPATHPPRRPFLLPSYHSPLSTHPTQRFPAPTINYTSLHRRPLLPSSPKGSQTLTPPFVPLTVLATQKKNKNHTSSHPTAALNNLSPKHYPATPQTLQIKAKFSAWPPHSTSPRPFHHNYSDIPPAPMVTRPYNPSRASRRRKPKSLPQLTHDYTSSYPISPSSPRSWGLCLRPARSTTHPFARTPKDLRTPPGAQPRQLRVISTRNALPNVQRALRRTSVASGTIHEQSVTPSNP